MFNCCPGKSKYTTTIHGTILGTYIFIRDERKDMKWERLFGTNLCRVILAVEGQTFAKRAAASFHLYYRNCLLPIMVFRSRLACSSITKFLIGCAIFFIKVYIRQGECCLWGCKMKDVPYLTDQFLYNIRI
jgi:hypothetical protein